MYRKQGADKSFHEENDKRGESGGKKTKSFNDSIFIAKNVPKISYFTG